MRLDIMLKSWKTIVILFAKSVAGRIVLLGRPTILVRIQRKSYG